MSVRVQIFVTPTCPSCEPVFEETFRVVEEVKKEAGVEISVEKIDVTEKENLNLALKYGVKSVPTIVVCGRKVLRGVPDKDILLDAVRGCPG